VSAGFNQATLLGRLCAPPEQLTTKAGKLLPERNEDGEPTDIPF
jgi:hypothetical protein